MEADLGYSFPMGSIQANVNNTICFDCQSNCTIDYPGLAFYGISGYSFGNTFNANLQYDLGSSSNQLTFSTPDNNQQAIVTYIIFTINNSCSGSKSWNNSANRCEVCP